MKTETRKYFVVLSIFTFLIAGASMNSIASGDDTEVHSTGQSAGTVDHDALASQYENLAREMQAKAEEQVEIFEHKPSANAFGKNARNARSHIAFRVREYEQSAAENLEKSAYHHKMATEQAALKSVAKPNRAHSKESS